MSAEEVLEFWFEELSPEDHFKKSDELDSKIRERFESLVLSAQKVELFSWRTSAKGRLAEIIVLDQFSRNIFRGNERCFSGDALALALSQEAVSLGCHKELEQKEAMFLLMPYMHSESSIVHEAAVALFKDLGMEGPYEYELKHKAIIDRFGRYPHRNEILGRESSQEEIEFLKTPGSSF